MWRCKRAFLLVILSTAFSTPSVTSILASDLPSHSVLRDALKAVIAEENGGFGFHMWATVVDRDGIVTAVVYSGEDRGAQWPGSRVISAQKANTANAFSLPRFALSTANLFSAVQPGGSLFGLQSSNPVATDVAYAGLPQDIGTKNDPMVGRRIGGINVFGGGLALYDSEGRLLGGLGLSGDSSCADHNIAWKLRHKLNLDNVLGGVTPANHDNIINDISSGASESGWGHPNCSPEAAQIAKELPTTHPVGPDS